MISTGLIDLNAEYQRGLLPFTRLSVWSITYFQRCRMERAQANTTHRFSNAQLLYSTYCFLFVSFLFFCPTTTDIWLRLALVTNPDDTDVRICIDGKQRLTSIQKCDSLFFS